MCGRNPSAPPTATAARIHAVLLPAYAQEAQLLGARDFPPLRRSAADPALALASSLKVFNAIGLVAIVIGVGFLALSPVLKKWSHGADDVTSRA